MAWQDYISGLDLSNIYVKYPVAATVFVVLYLMLIGVRAILLKYLGKLAEKIKSDVDDLLVNMFRAIGKPIYFLLALYLSANYFLDISSVISRAFKIAFLLMGTFYGVKVLNQIVNYGAKIVAEKRSDDDSSLVKVLGNILKGIFWVTAFVFLLSNMGLDVSTFIAGMGVGGIAIAFALQNILGDIFASFSIYFDKPFKVGDYIVVGQDRGIVQHVGIKSTRLKTLQGEELIISNKELTSVRVNNFKQMDERRINFKFGVIYQTPVKKVEKIPEWITKIIEDIDNARPDRVHFSEFGNSALNFEVVYYVETSEYKEYMDIQQKINLEMMKKFKKEGIDFAYPTQTIFLEK